MSDVKIDGNLAVIEFSRFDLDAYQLFLDCKKLPESQVSYDWRSDTYRLTTPARFADRLGVTAPAVERDLLPLADHLFDYQRWIVDMALDAKRWAVWADTGLGKQQPVSEPVLTPGGWRRIGDLQIGDEVIGADGAPTAVLGVYPQGTRRVYRLWLSDGSYVRAGSEHLWNVRTKADRYQGAPYRTLTTAEIADTLHRDWQLPMVMPVQHPGISLPLEPYALGVLLGDGALSSGPFRACTDNWIGESLGWRHLSDHGSTDIGYWAPTSEVSDGVRELELDGKRSWEKTVPAAYLHASEADRRALLQGLMDTDGYAMPDGGAEFSSTSRNLVDAVCELTRSLGGIARGLREAASTYDYLGEHLQGRPAWRVNIKLPAPHIPFRLPRKAAQYKVPSKYQPNRIIRRVEDEGIDEPQVCIRVAASDGLYVTRDHIITHNSHVIIEWCRQVMARTDGRVLILQPLSIHSQMIEIATEFYGDTLSIERIGTREALIAWCAGDGPAIGLVNYEKLIPGVIPEFRHLAGLAADEASILRTGGGVIKWNLIKSARGIEYKLSLTATPAPNEAMEYASQASFLEKLRTEGDILWTYFTRDPKTDEWRVKPHARQAFYEFMASWSVYLRNPAHFGFADILATLPPPVIREHALPITDVQRETMFGLMGKKGGLFNDDRLTLSERSKLSQLAKGFLYQTAGGKRHAARYPSAKPQWVADCVAEHVAADRQVMVWTVFDEEGEIIAEHLPDGIGYATLTGSQSDGERAEIIRAFKAGETAVLISKAVLLGYGLNLQNCRAMVFSGFDDSFERLYQSIRRAYRFGQTETVYVDIPVIPELEGTVFSNVLRKQAAFDQDTRIQEAHYRRVLGRDAS